MTTLSNGTTGKFRQRRNPHKLDDKWLDKIEDITYQVLLLEKLFPNVEVRPHLVLVDKGKRAAIDNIPGLFALVSRLGRDGVTRLHTARYIGTREQLAELDLVTEVDVFDEVALVREEVERAAATFESRLDDPLSVHLDGLELGPKCKKCEFRHDRPDAPNGFAECWGSLALPKPHMLELYRVSQAKAPDTTSLVEWMLRLGRASLVEIPTQGLLKANGEIGSVATRQRRQIEYTRSGETFIGPRLRANLEACQHPLFFIDFETSRLALPYHSRMRPYGLVAFQWSCHTVSSIGARPAHFEWLNIADIWPNQLFAESLRAAIGDSGPVLTWSPFEGSVLKEIVADLIAFDRLRPDLGEWMIDVFERRIIDMHEWATNEYYHYGMGGRTSIKAVLDALWKTDANMREQFEAWTGLLADAAQDPYAALPAIEINDILQNVREGTGAMNAYQEMMYGTGEDNTAIKEKWSALLKQYCKLDTLSMVLIFEHWRRLTGCPS